MPRRTLALVLTLTAALFAGCGGDDEGGETSTTAPKEQGPLNITRPAEDARLQAKDEGGRLVVHASVRGTADAGAMVVVNGGCNVEGCVVHGESGSDGRWTATVLLDAPAGEPGARITAYYQGSPVVGPSDEIDVRLVAPRSRRSGGDDDEVPLPDDPVPPSDIDPPSRRGSGTLVMVGDSLGVGIEGILPGLLPGWRITADNLTSRPLAQGMQILAGMRVPTGSVIAVSLFTNDDPSRLQALDAAVRTTVRRAGAGGCAVWATIARPPFGGRTYAAANALLRRLDAELGSKLAVVPWAELAAPSGWLAGDDVHATPEGYRQRARLYAEAAQSCG